MCVCACVRVCVCVREREREREREIEAKNGEGGLSHHVKTNDAAAYCRIGRSIKIQQKFFKYTYIYIHILYTYSKIKFVFNNIAKS